MMNNETLDSNCNEVEDDGFIEKDIAYCWNMDVMRKDANGNKGKVTKLYLHKNGMDFDKVLSFFNQESLLNFKFLTCLDEDEDEINYSLTEGIGNVGFDFVQGFNVFTWKDNVGELRKYLYETKFRLSKFFFTTNDGVCCYNNQNRYRWLEIDLEIPVSVKEQFINDVSEVDKSIGAIIKEAEKYPKSLLSFNHKTLIAIFPNVNKNLNSEFALEEKYSQAINLGFIESLPKYPFEW